MFRRSVFLALVLAALPAFEVWAQSVRSIARGGACVVTDRRKALALCSSVFMPVDRITL
jgi:hypothetical protein